MTLKLMSAIVSPLSSKENSANEGEDLLKQLLDCVKECQKRYGGKKELATEFDSCVAGLCLSLEAVFLHGLKTKALTAENGPSALKQVSDIVAHSLHITNETESPSFWPFVNKHLTKHEQERFDGLKQIWTDIGRGKAWIRSTLNEKSLERYFHTVLSNQAILTDHYETWAILRDDEKNSMLPNMAAGLTSILFAISIDKPELNSGIARRPTALKVKAEPIIEAPIPGKKENHKPKKKRKVARQLISFDDDDSAISTSVPSSSSSTTSDSFSLDDSNSTKEKSKRISKKKMEQPTEAEDEIRPRKLSMENSGSREKYYSAVESLTPVAQVEIGELRPVSVEINENFSGTAGSTEDAVEVPTDISAVLTAVELKNKEELDRKEEKIQLLTKQNESLQEQVKSYMSALQMLRRDDEGLNETLEKLQIEGQPDYKWEASFFQQKLLQVADMHAELMDFNVMLQQTIFQKDQMIGKLKKELEILRGPIPEMAMGESMSNVHVWIPSAFLTGSGSNSHHVYQIYLKAGNDEWNIYRRYAQFYALHTDLKKLDPAVASFDFPPKKSIGNKDSAIVEDRRKRLQVYLRRVLSHWPELTHCNNRFLLEQHLAFFKDQREDQRAKSTFSPPPSTSNSSGL
nr:unnamed protein product [Callosobruchus analis]